MKAAGALSPLHYPMSRVTKGISHFRMYIDDAIAFNSCSAPHGFALSGFLAHLRQRDVKSPQAKVRLSSTSVASLGHTITSTVLWPMVVKATALSQIPVPLNVS